MYCLNSLWMVYMIHENYDLVLMKPRCGMITLIYIYIHVLYEDYHPSFTGFHPILRWWLRSYEASKDGPMEWSHMGLINFMMCPVVGGMTDVSTTKGLGRNQDATMSSRGSPRPTLVLSLLYDIWWFWNIKFYVLCFKDVYMYILKRNTGGL